MREGAELVRASNRYAVEDSRRSWMELITTLLVLAAFMAATLITPWISLKAVGALFSGLTSVRLFILYHDYLHGAIFRGSKAGKAIMYVIGWWTLAAPSVWKETHDYHHKNNAKLLGSAIGSYPLVSIGIWKGMNESQRRMYRFVRSPITMLLAHPITFMVGMCIAPFRRAPRDHWSALFVLCSYWVVFGGLVYGIGLTQALFVMLIPGAITATVGAYLFYAQHNFPGAELRGRREWKYHHAALRCSSMFDMNPLMHWFTGNIGYHHIHHLNHRIPFYRLPEAMAEMPELQNPIRTSWAPSDIWACLSVAMWDPEDERLVTYAEAEQLIQSRSADRAASA